MRSNSSRHDEVRTDGWFVKMGQPLYVVGLMVGIFYLFLVWYISLPIVYLDPNGACVVVEVPKKYDDGQSTSTWKDCGWEKDRKYHEEIVGFDWRPPLPATR